MAKQLQLRRGTTAQHASFTGAVGEVTVDADKDTAVVHDASQAGGYPLLREDLNNLANSSITLNKIQPGTALYGLRTNAAGTAIEFVDFMSANLLFSRSPTSGAHTATLSDSMLNYKWLAMQNAQWSNISYMAVDVFSNSGIQHMIATYSTYHFYMTYTNSTQIYFASGTGNTAYKVWGLR
mgnify:FL=1